MMKIICCSGLLATFCAFDAGCGEGQMDLTTLEDLDPVGAPICAPPSIQLVKHYYVNCYQTDWLVPRWVGYRIAPEDLDGWGERQDNFKSDPDLPPSARSDNDDYRVGFDRGHMAPAGDFKRNQLAMDETFFLSNIAPQEAQFNRGPWADLEGAVRDFIQRTDEAWVFTGNLFLDENGYPTAPEVRIGYHGVAVPTHCWKTVVARQLDGSYKAVAYVLPNAYPPPANWQNYRESVDALEKLSGLNFNYALPDDVEARIEASDNGL